MSYSKPEVVVFGNSIKLIQSGQCKKAQSIDTVISGFSDATSTAYEADE